MPRSKLANILDAKSARMIGRLHARLQEGTFAETDALALLVLLRPFSSGSILDFADSMAHRERRKGPIFDYLLRNWEVLRKPPDQRDSVIDAVYSGEEIARSLNEVFERLKLAALSSDRSDDFVVFVASLLQGIRFERPIIGPLDFGYTRDFVGVWGGVEYRGNRFAVPVFGVRNRFDCLPIMGTGDFAHLFRGVVEVTAKNGHVMIDQVTGSNVEVRL